jgi:hypothetical protein
VQTADSWGSTWGQRRKACGGEAERACLWRSAGLRATETANGRDDSERRGERAYQCRHVSLPYALATATPTTGQTTVVRHHLSHPRAPPAGVAHLSSPFFLSEASPAAARLALVGLASPFSSPAFVLRSLPLLCACVALPQAEARRQAEVGSCHIALALSHTAWLASLLGWSRAVFFLLLVSVI